MSVKCHSEPENHKLLNNHGTNTLSLWEIYIAEITKKNEKNQFTHNSMSEIYDSHLIM
jgi:hypothetical protein